MLHSPLFYSSRLCSPKKTASSLTIRPRYGPYCTYTSCNYCPACGAWAWPHGFWATTWPSAVASYARGAEPAASQKRASSVSSSRCSPTMPRRFVCMRVWECSWPRTRPPSWTLIHCTGYTYCNCERSLNTTALRPPRTSSRRICFPWRSRDEAGALQLKLDINFLIFTYLHVLCFQFCPSASLPYQNYIAGKKKKKQNLIHIDFLV